MAGLPEDILYDIFSRIPIKSLARFQCICKEWRDCINDPRLVNIHQVKEEPKLLLTALFESSIPSHQRVSILSFLSVREDTTDRMQVKKDLPSRFLVKIRSQIQCYCNGLITLIRQHASHDLGKTFVVINPLTKECHELPPMNKKNRIGQGLGFDDSTKTFKMVCVLKKDRLNKGGVVVHVLGTDSWREITQVPFHPIRGEAVYANGRLYWLADIEHKLVWLDMKKEEFGVIDIPTKQREEGGWFHNELVDLNGEVGCLYSNYRPGGDDKKVVWILKHDEWKIHCVFDPDLYGAWVIVGCWNEDGDLLMTCRRGFRLYVYRLKSDSFHKLSGPEAEPGEEIIAAEVRMHQSSLLSIRKWH